MIRKIWIEPSTFAGSDVAHVPIHRDNCSWINGLSFIALHNNQGLQPVHLKSYLHILMLLVLAIFIGFKF